MKKLLSLILVMGMLFSLVVPVGASNVQWNLTEKPDFVGYTLHDYGYLDPNNPVLIEMSEANYSAAQVAALTNEFLKVIEEVEFVPGNFADYKAGEEIILAYFVTENWENDSTKDIIHLYITDKGICFQVWNRTSQTAQGAFVNCTTDGIISQICDVMADAVVRVDANRLALETEKREEQVSHETVLTSFEKLSYVKAKDINLYDKSGSKVTISLQTGICSYQISGSDKTEYAFYFNFGEEPDRYYICNKPENNAASYTDVSIYKITSGNNRGKYSIYDDDKETSRIDTEIAVGEDGYVNELYVLVKHSGFEGTITKEQLSQVGLFKDYGGLNIEISETETEEEPTTDVIDKEETPEQTEQTPEEEKSEIKEEAENSEYKTETEENLENTEEIEDTNNEEPAEEKTEPNSYADALNMLGLFKGTEDGYELESYMTRAQGATMIVRLLGKEKEALNGEVQGMFSDTPAEHWAAPYVEYCFNNLITKGTGDNRYSPDEPLSGSQFMTLVLRTLGYVDTEPQTAQAISHGCALLSAEEAYSVAQKRCLDRGTMVYISYRALTTDMASGKTLIKSLIDNSTVDEKLAKQIGLVQ